MVSSWIHRETVRLYHTVNLIANGESKKTLCLQRIEANNKYKRVELCKLSCSRRLMVKKKSNYWLNIRSAGTVFFFFSRLIRLGWLKDTCLLLEPWKTSTVTKPDKVVPLFCRFHCKIVASNCKNVENLLRCASYILLKFTYRLRWWEHAGLVE